MYFFRLGKIISKHFHILLQMKKKRSKIMTTARIQSLCTAHKNYLGYFDGKEV